MRHIYEIKPYNRYWGNCITNMFLSLLLQREKSYEPIIYMNDYEYKITGTGLYVDYSMEYYNFFPNFFAFKRCNFPDKKELIRELKQILLNNKYITLNVDLFYWCDQGAFYNRVHNPHYSFLIGFDEEKARFYAFEDDVNLDYEIREIPEERLVQAFNSEFKDGREDYRLIYFKDRDLKPYELKLDKVLSNAESLIAHLEGLIESRHILNKAEINSDLSYIYRFGNECGKVPNRQKGNVLLLGNLLEQGLIDQTYADAFTRKTEQLNKGWEVIKSMLHKCYFSKKAADLNKVENMIIDLFINERDLWREFTNQNKHE